MNGILKQSYILHFYVRKQIKRKPSKHYFFLTSKLNNIWEAKNQYDS